jgi:hypothetical protein
MRDFIVGKEIGVWHAPDYKGSKKKLQQYQSNEHMKYAIAM